MLQCNAMQSAMRLGAIAVDSPALYGVSTHSLVLQWFTEDDELPLHVHVRHFSMPQDGHVRTVQRATDSMQHTTCKVQHATGNIAHATCSVQDATCSSCVALSM
jgi:hypothetical protein